MPQPGLLLVEALAVDGPYAEAAERWLHKAVCSRCFQQTPADDGICAYCIEQLSRADHDEHA